MEGGRGEEPTGGVQHHHHRGEDPRDHDTNDDRVSAMHPRKQHGNISVAWRTGCAADTYDEGRDVVASGLVNSGGICFDETVR